MKGMMSLFVAYLAIWILMLVYLLRLDAKAKTLAREVEALRKELGEATAARDR